MTSEFASIQEVVAAWQEKRLRESELITILTEWPYVPTPPFDPWDDLWVPPAGTLVDLEDELRAGHIPDYIYDAILELRAAKEENE